MPYCRNCGKPIFDGDSYCRSCGMSTTDTYQNAQPAYQVPLKPGKPRHRNLGIGLTIIGVLLVSIALMGWLLTSPFILTPFPIVTPISTPSPTTTPTSTPTTSPKPSPTEPQVTSTSSPTPTPTLSPFPTSTSNEEIFVVENLRGLFELSSEMSYRWSDSNDTQINVNYIITGEETVEGAVCWVVETFIDSDGEETMLTVWISQDNGSAEKIMIEGEELTGGIADMIWEIYSDLLMWPFFVGSSMNLWEIHYLTDPAYGNVQHIGSESQMYGETELIVHKYTFKPGSAWYDPELDYFDYWLADLGPYMLVSYFKYSYLNGEWGSYELLAI